jgi:hypothetical protein
MTVLTASIGIWASLKRELIALYKGNGDALDSVGTNNGTAVLTTHYAAGLIDQAFECTPTKGGVTVANDSWVFQNFSVSMWVKAPTGVFTVLAYSTDLSTVTKGWQLTVQVDGRISLYCNGSNTYSTAVLPNNTWANVTVTKKLGELPKFYINGVITPSTGGSLLPIVYSGTKIAGIGSRSTIGAVFIGLMQYIKVWNYPITQTEVTANYNGGVPIA